MTRPLLVALLLLATSVGAAPLPPIVIQAVTLCGVHVQKAAYASADIPAVFTAPGATVTITATRIGTVWLFRYSLRCMNGDRLIGAFEALVGTKDFRYRDEHLALRVWASDAWIGAASK